MGNSLVYLIYCVQTCMGKELDDIGEAVGVARWGNDDHRYRMRILECIGAGGKS